MKTIRAFIAHSKGTDAEALPALRHQIVAALQREATAAGSDAAITATLGREHHAQHFKRCGSWDAWARDVALGVHPVTRQPVHDLIVVPAGPVGKATAEIVRYALEARVRVVEYCNGTFRKVKSITALDDQDYKAGWRLG